ncbi:MAG: arsenical pump rane protein [Gaiellales bacterium]|nr:arsenical pump rane protein [Gaiellales bacterium]
MSDSLALLLALAALAAALATAVTRPRLLPEALVATAGAAMLVAVGASSVHAARFAISELASTVCFLAALLVLAEGCRREGLFMAIGSLLARRARGSAHRLLALVFAVAAVVTVVLSLDATVVLLTPIVFVTASQLRTSPRPHVFACAHLANSASLLLPVSNLTNLLAFHASGLSFTRFAALMALPWIAALGVEWSVLSRSFHPPRADEAPVSAPREAPVRWPRAPLVILAATLAGFALSSLAGLAPVWIAVAGAVAITLPALLRGGAPPAAVVRSADPAFLLFVLALGVIVGAASNHGLESAMRHVMPDGTGLADLLAIAAICALLANAVNNLPAILIALPALAGAAGPGPLLAALLGVNIGPNLTYVGSLATLLWRRVLRAEGYEVGLAEFSVLGLLTVPAGIVAATLALWLGLHWLA